MEILVYKTNIQFKEDIQRVGDIFTKEKDILAWSVDNEDCDNVLRIEATNDISLKVEYMVQDAGYYCEVLL